MNCFKCCFRRWLAPQPGVKLTSDSKLSSLLVQARWQSMKIPNLSWKTNLRSNCLCFGLVWIPPMSSHEETGGLWTGGSSIRVAPRSPHTSQRAYFPVMYEQRRAHCVPCHQAQTNSPQTASCIQSVGENRISAQPNKRLMAKNVTKTHQIFIRPLGFHSKANCVSAAASSGLLWLSCGVSRCSSALLNRKSYLQMKSKTQEVDISVAGVAASAGRKKQKIITMKEFLCYVAVVIVPACKYTSSVLHPIHMHMHVLCMCMWVSSRNRMDDSLAS